LLPHQEDDIKKAVTEDAYKIIKPLQLNIISYPYEWCFSQLKDAALLTLEIQQIALQHGMVLKDASAYNIQFYKGKPVFIDTLSFEVYKEGSPWVAYRQFCQHFLVPLVLMKYNDVRMNQLSKVFLDGIPLDFAVKQLPTKCLFNFALFSHIFMHAKSQKYFGGKQVAKSIHSMSKFQLTALIDNMQSFIVNCRWKLKDSEWGNYYSDTNYSDEAHAQKQKIVRQFLLQTSSGLVLDIGGNVGTYSRLANNLGREAVCLDIDPVAVEKNYLSVKNSDEKKLLPLIMDVTNPSPGIGWGNEERQSFFQRISADTIIALALLHHLAISNNLPFQKIAVLFRNICKYCIIEWIPKEDSQVQRLLATRQDIFTNYSKEQFEKCFNQQFDIIEKVPIEGSLRTVYLLMVKTKRN